MTQAAVEERPATSPETETSPAIETEGRSTSPSTDEREEAQTGTGANSTDDPAPDGATVRRTALAEAERQEAEEKGYEKAHKELQETNTLTQRQVNRNRLKQSFPQAQAKIDSIIADAKDAYGNPRPLTDVETKAVKDALAGHNLVAFDAATAEVGDIVKDAVYAQLQKAGKTAVEGFTAATNADTELPEYLTYYAEHAALSTKAVKGMSLEDALKVSPKLRKEIEALKLSEFEAGRDEGRPTGTSPDRGRGAQRTAPGSMTWADLEDGYGKGTLNKEQTAEYRRLRTERAKSR